METQTSSIKKPWHFIVNSGFGLVMIIAFFLPWLKMSCQGMTFSEPSGYHLAMNVEDSRLKELKQMQKEPPDMQTDNQLKNGEEPWGGKTLELWFIPIFGLIILLLPRKIP